METAQPKQICQELSSHILPEEEASSNFNWKQILLSTGFRRIYKWMLTVMLELTRGFLAQSSYFSGMQFYLGE